MTVLDVVQKFVAEESDTARNGTGGRVAERTEGLPTDVIADVKQESYVLLFAVTMFQALQYLGHPIRAFAAGRAFTAGLIAVELRHTQDSPYNARIFVDDDNSTGTKHGTSSGDRLEVERRVNFV